MFSINFMMVVGFIVGGQQVMFQVVEGVEDDVDCGVEELNMFQFGFYDVVVGLVVLG